MDHNKIRENNWLEKYLFHELSESEERILEEHLLYCDDCISELETLKKSVKTIEYIFDKTNEGRTEEPPVEKPVNKFKLFYRIAAVFLLLIASVALFYQIEPRPEQENIISENKTSKPAEPSLNNSKHDSQVNDIQNKENADDFIQHPIFENEIKNIYRSKNLSVIKPDSNTIFNSSEHIAFKWIRTPIDSVYFVLVNNKGDELLNVKTITLFNLKEHLKPGLYYWQLQSDSETLFTGKFKIKVR